tara:strand:+ start:27361 stop:27939 length:579 start_codon:yes stop_codon:yes gene_type:complete
MVDLMGITIGVFLTVAFVGIHLSRGQHWQPTEDITQSILAQRSITLSDTSFPEPMSRAAGAVVMGASVSLDSSTEAVDSTLEESSKHRPQDIPDTDARVFKIEYVKEGVTLEVKENQTLLEAGEEQGWDMPYACKEGSCLSCAGKITNGSAAELVFHDDQEMISSDELNSGYCLTCVAYPVSDLRLETGESP